MIKPAIIPKSIAIKMASIINLMKNCKQIREASNSAMVAITPKRNKKVIKSTAMIKPNINPKIAFIANNSSDITLKTKDAIIPVKMITNKKIKNTIHILLSLRNSLLALLSYAKCKNKLLDMSNELIVSRMNRK